MNDYYTRKAQLPIQKGDKVKLPKGIDVHTTHTKKNYMTKRSTTITVFDVAPEWQNDGQIHPADICWVGSGGYWCYTNMSNVIKI
jgi:hypothetical protein